MNKLLLLLSLLPLSVFADRPFELDSLYVDYKKFDDSNRDPLFYNSTKKESISLVMNTNFLSYFYLDNRVHGETNNAKYELVGLEARIGLRLTNYMEVGYYHHSQHLLDDKYPYQKFPVDDAVEIRLYIYGNSHREGLFR